MQFFAPGRIYDFMAQRRRFAGLSLLMTAAALVALFVYPKPKFGTDFMGGTEVEVAFEKPVDPGAVRAAVVSSGFSQPEVIPVAEGSSKNRYLIRVEEVSTIGEEQARTLARALCIGEGVDPVACPEEKRGAEMKISPGGEKVMVRYRAAPDLSWVRERASTVGSLSLRDGANNPSLQNARDHKVEIQLKSKGDQLLDGLREKLGADTVPASALRVEWIGPKAGAQLRNSALKSIAVAIVFIMIYVAFRFDLRFAPGAVVSMAHDIVATIGVVVFLGREINLTTVAALLTVLGYSVNDTVVVYDRIRENFGIQRGATFESIINISISEMLGRTLLTGTTVILVLVPFFVWGTGPLRDFSLILIVGLVLGTYSSIYIAAPFTWWLDRLFFSGAGGDGKGPGARPRVQKKDAAVVCASPGRRLPEMRRGSWRARLGSLPPWPSGSTGGATTTPRRLGGSSTRGLPTCPSLPRCSTAPQPPSAWRAPSGKGNGSPSSATTTATASRRRRFSPRCSGGWVARSCRSLRAASTVDTGSRRRRQRGCLRPERPCSSRATAGPPTTRLSARSGIAGSTRWSSTITWCRTSPCRRTPS